LVAFRAPGKERLKDEVDERWLSGRILRDEAKPDLCGLKQVPVESLDLSRWCLHNGPTVARGLER
jgi:hypothetical protein